MEFKTITYGKSATKNTGDYENIKINFEATVEVDENESVEEAQATLKEYVDSFLNEEINKYSEKTTIEEKKSIKKPTQQTEQKPQSKYERGDRVKVKNRWYWEMYSRKTKDLLFYAYDDRNELEPTPIFKRILQPSEFEALLDC